jgi:hypothetical protein
LDYEIFDDTWALLIFGLLSSFLWFCASFINIPADWDADPNSANKKISMLNAAAALSASIAVGVQIFNQFCQKGSFNEVI